MKCKAERGHTSVSAPLVRDITDFIIVVTYLCEYTHLRVDNTTSTLEDPECTPKITKMVSCVLTFLGN